jgi:hypothetical protein
MENKTKPREMLEEEWEDYQTYLDMLEEGYRREDAAVLSGWKGAEEITGDK